MASGAKRKLSGLFLAGALAGCAGTPGKEPEVSTGLAHLGGPDAPVVGGPSPIPDDKPKPNSLAAAAAHNAALDLLAWQDRKEQAAEDGAKEQSVSGDSPSSAEPAQPVSAEPSSEVDVVLGPPAPSDLGLDEKIGAAAGELEGLLRQRATGASDRFGAALELAALSPLRPGVADELAAWPDLSPAERRTIQMLGTLVSGLAAPGVGGDPARAADALQGAMDDLGSSLPLRIGAAELCTRVDGFGQYQPVEGNAFEAMRPHRVIVYTEVERFGYRPIGEADLAGHRAGPGDRWAVSLTQQLELYNETGAMSAWSRPALPIVETSRNRRRDFHIVDQIDLPPNLSIGVYHLKITVKDKATGAQDSRSIELRIVADPALARVGR